MEELLVEMRRPLDEYLGSKVLVVMLWLAT